LDNAIRFQFAVANHFGGNEQAKEKQGLIGDLKAKNGKHW